MLTLENLTVQLAEQDIIKNLNVAIPAGEVHVIMGPNGSGKSTLARALAGHPDYTTSGKALLESQDILEMDPQQRALAGLFVAFQYPVEIPGVSVMNFLKASLNAHRQAQNLPPWDAADLMQKAKEQMSHVGLEPEFLYRALNAGFSGGEKKRCELLQMRLLEPKLVILDETDSGLDVDAFKMMASCIKEMRTEGRSFVVITHYEHLVDALQPDVVHIFKKGKICQSGGGDVLAQLRGHGYQSFE